eukprot:TRINITY_DN1709_c0_g1_i4.p3 TRINITY_DN1709_c0_g1~~TRINITY_DN1709_c0_g1_i4.p3  ORF type:complete len:251 (+),score=22.64 TRINITY_DN1709_c0_g1_i4:856-1608(+)
MDTNSNQKAQDQPNQDNGTINEQKGESPALLKYPSPRWVWLRKQDFITQLLSAESLTTLTFLTVSDIILEFYIGTARVQLTQKGDVSHFYTNLTGPMQALGFIAIPLVGWLLDDVGFGITMLVILIGGIVESLLQAIPNLQVQFFTLLLWTVVRFCLYAQYYLIVGSIFGFTHFGKLVGVKSAINGVAGFIQYPALQLVLGPLDGQFIYANIAQAVILGLMLPFCFLMMRWARPDAQPPKRYIQKSLSVD